MIVPNFLVTGANGFIGRHIVKALASSNVNVRCSVRSSALQYKDLPSDLELCAVGNIDKNTCWSASLQNIDTVIHCAALAHVMNQQSEAYLDLHKEINLFGTLRLAKQAAASGVKRFIFVSSIGVNGNESVEPFKETSAPNPTDSYSISKWEAEQALINLGLQKSLEIVIIRPPLVYGAGAPGNFGRLARYVKRGWPLPLGSVHNQRSLIAVSNLVDFIVTCSKHPLAANQTFLISDGKDLSTTELVQGMAHAFGVPARLLPIPQWGLQFGASLIGKEDMAQRLCGNLQIDIAKARMLLGWVPPITVEEGLKIAMERGI